MVLFASADHKVSALLSCRREWKVKKESDFLLSQYRIWHSRPIVISVS